MAKRARQVIIVLGYGGWWIRRLQINLNKEDRWVGNRAYTTENRAAAAARRRGYTVLVAAVSLKEKKRYV